MVLDTYSQLGRATPCRRSSPASRRCSAAPRRAARATGPRRRLRHRGACCERLGRPLRDQRVVVQGFGNVGATAAAELQRDRRQGRRRLRLHAAASSTRTGSTSRRVAALGRRARRARGLPARRRRSAARRCSRSPCDILIPAALERQITAENADAHRLPAHRRGRQRPDHARGRGRSSPSAGSSSSPTCSPTPAASPSATSSGSRTSRSTSGTSSRSRSACAASCAPRSARVVDTAGRLSSSVDWRTAALAVAVERVAEAARLRAIYPAEVRRRSVASSPVAAGGRDSSASDVIARRPRAASCSTSVASSADRA